VTTPPPDGSAGPAELQHPRFARSYARAVAGMNRRGGTAHRRALLAGLKGSVVEIGAGEGSAFGLYPDSVIHVLAVEPDNYLRSLAEGKVPSASVPVTVAAGSAERIPAADASVDAVVTSLVLCSVADQAAVLAEARRVLRPGGTLAYYEHVRSRYPVLAAAEDVLTPAWQRMAGGCHPNRDTLQAIIEAGFTVQQNRRFGFSVSPLAPAVAHILGHATAPGPGVTGTEGSVAGPEALG
jgi:ubiquinone/menaquinone biosynthesis C-methylase UbiE